MSLANSQRKNYSEPFLPSNVAIMIMMMIMMMTSFSLKKPTPFDPFWAFLERKKHLKVTTLVKGESIR